MKVIWKYRVPVQHDVVDLEIPAWSTIKDVWCNDNVSVEFWAEVEPRNQLVFRRFKVFGTGHEVPVRWEYVGTGHGQPFVWHLYEDVIWVPTEDES